MTMNIIKNFLKDKSGATAIEYGLLASLIAVAIIASVTTMGTKLSDTFNNISNGLGKKQEKINSTPNSNSTPKAEVLNKSNNSSNNKSDKKNPPPKNKYDKKNPLNKNNKN
ncbi:Flp family type IVb pilin [Candidatus Liberibacter brunswickensis]